MDPLTQKIKEAVTYMKKAHANDPKSMELLDEIELLLQKDISKTISTLNELDLLSIEWICPTFENVSYQLKNREFILCLDGLLEKFAPNSNGFKDEVQEAKNIFFDTQS
jgi:hypothetical protein